MQAIFAVMSTTSRTGLNYFQALFFTTAYIVFITEERFHIHFYIRSSYKWFSYIYSQKLRQVDLILTLLFTIVNSNQKWKY